MIPNIYLSDVNGGEFGVEEAANAAAVHPIGQIGEPVALLSFQILNFASYELLIAPVEEMIPGILLIMYSRNFDINSRKFGMVPRNFVHGDTSLTLDSGLLWLLHWP